MCDLHSSFILCSCKNEDKKIIHHKNSKRLQKKREAENPAVYPQFRWSLRRFVGTYNPNDYPFLMEGFTAMPSDIVCGLERDFVELELNSRNCFDFEYKPNEGDELSIACEKGRWQVNFMSFIFKNGNWVFDTHDPFRTITELIDKGNIQFNKNSNED